MLNVMELCRDTRSNFIGAQ